LPYLDALRDKPIAPASPWQNGFAERLIGSIRRECLDHIVVFGEAHLLRILRSYARLYNDVRTHRSLDKDSPIARPVLGSPWVFFIDEVRHNIGLKIAAIVVVVASYLLFLLLIPVMLGAIIMSSVP
jgi:hypothetical protein